MHSLDEIREHLPREREKCILIGEIDEDEQAFGIERVNPTSVINHLHYARAVKTDYELDCSISAESCGTTCDGWFHVYMEPR